MLRLRKFERKFDCGTGIRAGNLLDVNEISSHCAIAIYLQVGVVTCLPLCKAMLNDQRV